MEETQHYNSDEEEGEGHESHSPPKKVRGKAKSYQKEETFPTKNEAEAFVESVGCWGVQCGQKPSLQGMKRHYVCRKFSKDHPCPARLYLLFHAEDSRVSVFRSENNHIHGAPVNRGIPLHVQTVIEQLFDDKITKPKQILLALRNRNVEVPKQKQLENLLTKLRTKKYGSSTISMGELEEWCKGHSDPPEDEDTPFVVSHNLVEGDDGEADSQQLRIFLSTIRLLQNTYQSDVLHADATYKLIWQGFPVLMIGTTDINRTFHPTGIAVCSTESVSDFKFLFKFLSEGVNLITGFDFKPRYLVADGADAITRGFEEVFGTEYVRVMCWFHVLKNVEHNKHFLILPKEMRQELKNDICFLQLSPTRELFWKGVELFEEKWSSVGGTADFLEYFRIQWLEKYPNWFEGAALTVPSTNNALEGTNGVIKTQNTLRQRLPLGQFLQVFQEICHNWSEERDPQNVNHKNFATKVSYSIAAWTDAYQWVKKGKTVRQKTVTSTTTYFVPAATLTQQLTANLVQEFQDKCRHLEWNTFAEFKKSSKSIWQVTMSDNKWEDAVCTCPKFLKVFCCKHILGMAIRLRLVQVPAAAKTVPIGQKRKRGRPTLAKAALVRQ